MTSRYAMETFDDWRPWSCAPRDQEILIRGDGVHFVGKQGGGSWIYVNRPVEGAIVRHVGALSRVIDNLFFRIKFEGLSVLDEAES